MQQRDSRIGFPTRPDGTEVRGMKKVRKLYVSTNGDRWYLVHDPEAEVFIRHEANIASGGAVTHIGIAEFLGSGRGPEQQELLRLIGSLVADAPQA